MVQELLSDCFEPTKNCWITRNPTLSVDAIGKCGKINSVSSPHKGPESRTTTKIQWTKASVDVSDSRYYLVNPRDLATFAYKNDVQTKLLNYVSSQFMNFSRGSWFYSEHVHLKSNLCFPRAYRIEGFSRKVMYFHAWQRNIFSNFADIKLPQFYHRCSSKRPEVGQPPNSHREKRAEIVRSYYTQTWRFSAKL